MLYLGYPGEHLYLIPPKPLTVGRLRVEAFLVLFINMLLDVQYKYPEVSYLIDYIVYELHFWYTRTWPENANHPGSLTRSQFRMLMPRHISVFFSQTLLGCPE